MLYIFAVDWLFTFNFALFVILQFSNFTFCFSKSGRLSCFSRIRCCKLACFDTIVGFTLLEYVTACKTDKYLMKTYLAVIFAYLQRIPFRTVFTYFNDLLTTSVIFFGCSKSRRILVQSQRKSSTQSYH